MPVQKLHGDVGLLAAFPNVVNGADVGMVESGSGASFTPEAFQRLRVPGHVIWQELQRDEPAELRILGLVYHSHAAAAELFQNAVARDSLADHQGQILRGRNWQVNEGHGVGAFQVCC